MINVTAIISDHRDEIPKSGERSNRGKSVTEIRLVVVFNQLVFFALYGAIRIVFLLVDSFGANWLD